MIVSVFRKASRIYREAIMHPLIKWTITFTQFVVYVLVSRLLRYFFRANRKVSKTMSALKKGSLIISNHQSVLDPFIILSHLPIRVFLRMLPIRFPTTHDYYKYLRFLFFVGAYDIGADKRERMIGLFRTRQFLMNRESVMIFPEGKISEEEEILEFKKGITFLTDIATNVIFVRMEGFSQKHWIRKKTRRSVAFSDVCDLSGNCEDHEYIRKLLQQISTY